ncbi:hypothetical protein PVK06_011531 [Gossypium arboreum]|uniref:Uncharacterized protein n=1 Tax=Gossypium arboreum TaxID=29729 RepID=A0ABR0Q9Z7_GOSAR|nr:hypothetical protein PVK06_011531 [Gossypium arboreum]
MNIMMEEVKHDTPELKDKGHSTIIEHNELNVGVQQEFGIEDHDEIESSEVLHEHMYHSFDAGTTVQGDTTLYHIKFMLTEVIVPQNEF